MDNKRNTLPTCKHHFRPDTFTPMPPISLSASSQPHFPLFRCFCDFCSTLLLPSSLEPFLLVFATFSIHFLNSLSTKQQLPNYGYKACAEITCLNRSMTDRQTTSAFTSQHRGSLHSHRLLITDTNFVHISQSHSSTFT